MSETDTVHCDKLGDDVTTSTPESTTIDFDKPDSLVGRRLDGRFLIERNLTDDGGADQGGIGVVYLATDLKLMGKEVVVKILQEAALKHQDIVRKFQHEKEALIRLDHPGVVRILDSGSLKDGNPFMVMEYIKGYSLRKPMREKGPLPLHVVAHLVQCITDALGAAHAEKILHRDIKPENIMLTPQGDDFDRVRLIDFGIARVGDSQLAPQTEIGRPIGTVLYIAPEQLVGRLDLTPAVDIYATAIVAYEMLTGQLPFTPKAIAEMYQLQREGVVTPPTELRVDMPREAERILMSALGFEPEKRPQNARFWGQYLARELVKNSGDTDRFFASIKTEYAKMPTEIMPPVETGSLPTVQRIEPQRSARRASPWIKWGIPAMLLIGLISAAALYMASRAMKPEPAAATSQLADVEAPRKLSYSLRVQKMRDGKPFEAPFKSSGQEVFETGYKFQMAFQSVDEGNIYVFNEGVDAQGRPGYYLLFPTPSVNGGSPHVAAAQPIETAQNTFTGGKGTEIIWLIWTKDKAEDLDKVVNAAFAARGAVDTANGSTLQVLLDKYKSAPREVTKDTTNQETVIKTSGDTVVHRFEIEHR